MKKILNELKVHGYKQSFEGKNIISISGDIFIYDDENEDEVAEKLEELYDIDFYDIDDDDGVIDNKTIIKGSIQDNMLHVDVGTDESPVTSTNSQLKQIVKQLGLDSVRVNATSFKSSGEEEDINYEISREEILKTIDKKTFYHGTSYKNFANIINKGIIPTQKTNFTNIIHENSIFITTKLEKAFFHAETAAGKDNSIPVIIYTRIPDKDKLVLDYDVAVKYYGREHEITEMLGYDIVLHSALKGDMEAIEYIYPANKLKHLKSWERIADKNSLNTKLGSFGYTGKILPNHFIGFSVDSEAVALTKIADDIGLEYEELLTNHEENGELFRDIKSFKASVEHFYELYKENDFYDYYHEEDEEE